MDQADQNYLKKSLKIHGILALSLREDAVYVLWLPRKYLSVWCLNQTTYITTYILFSNFDLWSSVTKS